MFNLIASQSNRTSDVQTYPHHRAILWADHLGSSKLHAKVAAGGFGGAICPKTPLFQNMERFVAQLISILEYPSFTYSKSFPMISITLFNVKIPFYILGAKINVYFEGFINGNLTLAVNIGLPSTTTSLTADPTVTITAGAYLKVLVSF